MAHIKLGTYKFGRGVVGEPIPRILNPLVFAVVALACAVSAVLIGIAAVSMLVLTPFSVFWTIRKTS